MEALRQSVDQVKKPPAKSEPGSEASRVKRAERPRPAKARLAGLPDVFSPPCAAPCGLESCDSGGCWLDATRIARAVAAFVRQLDEVADRHVSECRDRGCLHFAHSARASDDRAA